MDFDPESWEISAETDKLNQELFGNHHIPPKKGKDQKSKVKWKKSGKTDKVAESSDIGMPNVKKKGKKREHEAKSNDGISRKKRRDRVDLEDSLSEDTKISNTKKKGKKRHIGTTGDSNSMTGKEGVESMDSVSEISEKGKKRKHKSDNDGGNSMTEEKSVENVDSLSKALDKSNDSETTGKRKKKSRSSKNKFKTGNLVTQNPGGKNFQKRDIKEKVTSDSNMTSVTCGNGRNSKKITENFKTKKIKFLQEALPISVCDVIGQTMKNTESLESSDHIGDSIPEIRGKKKKKSKPNSDITRPQGSKRSDTTSKEQSVDSLVNDSKSSNRKVRKKTYDTAILSGILAAESESKKVISKDKLNETGNKKGMSEPQAKKKKKQKNKVEEEPSEKEHPPKSHSQEEEKPPNPQTLKERLMEQLNSARFRYINEQLYTHSGEEAQEMFAEDEESFHVYHQGFQTQVNKWPVNPVDVIIQDIKKLPHNKVVADFGCGDTKVARGVPQKVHSFDLVALNDHVTACDMSHVPLKSGSVDIAVFCLSLMGTNLTDYLAEAHRVLKMGGHLKIAEVASRFQSLPQFLLNVEQFGFYQESKDTSNKMFYLFNFKKTGKPKSKLPSVTLQPCVYKKR